MAELDAVFLRPLAKGKTLTLLVYYGSICVGKLVKMGGCQVVDRPSTPQNVLEIMNSKGNVLNKD